MRQYEAFLPLVSWNTVFPAGNLLKLIRFPILVRNATGRNLNFTWTFSQPCDGGVCEGEGRGAIAAVGHGAGVSWALSEGH